MSPTIFSCILILNSICLLFFYTIIYPHSESAQLHGFAVFVHETVLLDIIIYDIRFSVGSFFMLPLNQGMTIFCKKKNKKKKKNYGQM